MVPQSPLQSHEVVMRIQTKDTEPERAWMDTAQLADRFGVSKKYLERLAQTDKGPPHIILGRGRRYYVPNADKWAMKRKG